MTYVVPGTRVCIHNEERNKDTLHDTRHEGKQAQSVLVDEEKHPRVYTLHGTTGTLSTRGNRLTR